MSAKKSRFNYLKQEGGEPAADVEPKAAGGGELRSLPRGAGRMAQDREQLNIRLPTTLKRRAMAQATLEGRTIGEVVEDLLNQYLSQAES